MVLMLISLMDSGPYLAYDSIGALSILFESEMGFTSTAIGIIVSAYSIPNIFTIFTFGLMVDKFGSSKMSILFNALVVGGCAFVAAGKNLYVIVLGRALFGIGAEGMYVVRAKLLKQWFSDGNMTLSYGFGTALAESFSAIGYVVLPLIGLRFGLRWALWFVVLAECLVMADSFLVMYLNKKRKKDWTTRKVKLSKNKKKEKDTEEFKFSHVVHLPKSFYVLTISICFVELPIWIFFSYGPLILQEQYGWTPEQAGGAMSMFGMGVLLSPVVGVIADKLVTYHFLIIYLGCVSYLISFVGMAFDIFNPMAAMVGIVLTYVIMEPIVWSAPSLLIRNSVTGTAYGMISLLANIFWQFSHFCLANFIQELKLFIFLCLDVVLVAFLLPYLHFGICF